MHCYEKIKVDCRKLMKNAKYCKESIKELYNGNVTHMHYMNGFLNIFELILIFLEFILMIPGKLRKMCVKMIPVRSVTCHPM